MSTILPFNLDDLLHCRGVESERVEFKASWDPVATGPQVLRTICAFANDYHNLNGGYVVIGVEERDGRAALPPRGLSPEEIDAAQKWIRGNCNRLVPPYPPILSPETVAGRHILVVWVPGSDMRPHRAPARRGRDLQTARVPWDDRRALKADIDDLREVRVREYLRDVDSGLRNESREREVYRRLRITTKVNDHEVPRNVGLLFFSRDPVRWFRGARIEVVQFTADRAGDVQEERVFGGGPWLRCRSARTHEGLSVPRAGRGDQLSGTGGRNRASSSPPGREGPGRAGAESPDRRVPEGARRRRGQTVGVAEGVSGDGGQRLARAGVRFRRAAHRVPGHLAGPPRIRRAVGAQGRRAPASAGGPRRGASTHRDRVGDPPDIGHPGVRNDHGVRAARRHPACRGGPGSVRGARLEGCRGSRRKHTGRGAGEGRRREPGKTTPQAQPFRHVRPGRHRRRHPRPSRTGFAHRYFEQAGDAVHSDPRALLEFAQTKIWLAAEAHRRGRRESNRRFLTEARALLERVVQMDASPARHAWAWRELGRVLRWLGMPVGEVERAYERAISLLPDEPRFAREKKALRERGGD